MAKGRLKVELVLIQDEQLESLSSLRSLTLRSELVLACTASAPNIDVAKCYSKMSELHETAQLRGME